MDRWMDHAVEFAYISETQSFSFFPLTFVCFSTGTRYKYMDVPNPSKPANSGLAPNPADSFVHLAPMSMPANLFVPCSGLCQQCKM